MEPILRKEMFMAKAAGQNVNVPEPITREEKYLAAIVASGGGGGDSRFVVNVTRDAEYKPSFDKTYEEIMDACLARKEVVLRDAPLVYSLSNFDPDEGYCAFINFGNQFDNELGFFIIRIELDGYWYESGGTVNCTMNWTDTNKPS